MIKVKKDTTLVGISEFCTKGQEILNELKTHKVIIERRNKPVAMLLSLKKYEKMQEVFEWIEDHIDMAKLFLGNCMDIGG